MTTSNVILIGPGGLAAAIAEMQEPTPADYSMSDVDALFANMFGVEPMLVAEFEETCVMCDPEDFGMTAEEYAQADAEAEEQVSYAYAHDALMRMLDVFSQVSGHPVTTEQRVAMTLLLANDDTAEAFATAAEDLLNSGLFE